MPANSEMTDGIECLCGHQHQRSEVLLSQTMHALLIEDHERLAEFICKGLENEEFSVFSCSTGHDGLMALDTGNFDVAVLDLGLPDIDGMELLRDIRGSGNKIPILILTARINVSDRIDGLNAGADDYLTKPFDMNELVARLHALLRRPAHIAEKTLRAGNMTLDPGARQVYVDNVPIEISRKEAVLLEQLMRRVGKVIPRKQLEHLVYGDESTGASNPLEVMVHRLRKKLEDAGSKSGIHTVRGVGYMIIDD